ncbi:hypothetical protein [Duganella qianjiadongensis]|uniref:Uncharacterized protein n=1 Tax=Duganella qianjiadongensis TaxID=2692176 RepID=A0ABW9VJN7_9BURK|nr:hypothetical protein [Duganella qianjiadongensis]MYM39665.1 hypothetical protein [Duganella qianjiadongensis]
MKEKKLIVFAAVGLAVVLLTRAGKATAAAKAQLAKAKADAYQLPYDFGIHDPSTWD